MEITLKFYEYLLKDTRNTTIVLLGAFSALWTIN